MRDSLESANPDGLNKWETEIKGKEGDALPLRLIDIVFLVFLLDAHNHPVFRDTHVSLLHALGCFIRHFIGHRVASITDETSHSNEYEEYEEGKEIRKAGHSYR